ncbi:MAG: DUF1634 domain-containing protein [Chitinophagaceae bacterium]|nr:MAG: DUF1634 domain-containing protein [Chitinophagaceae bacterium]
MSEQKNHHKLEIIVGNTLRYGVWAALFFSFIGLMMILIQAPHATTHLQELPDIPIKFSFVDLWQGMIHFDATHITMLGVFILLITPLLRVVFALFAYWFEGNILYTFITVIVLIIIGISVWIGVKH